MKFNKLIPELMVSDFKKSLEFYKSLGFKLEYERKNFAFLSIEGSQIMIQGKDLENLLSKHRLKSIKKHKASVKNERWKTGKLEYPYGRGINFQIQVKSVNSLLKKIRSKYKLFEDLQENWYKKGNKLLGNKEFLIQDCDGYLLRFFQDLGEKSMT